MAKGDDLIKFDGVVKEVLPATMYRVELENTYYFGAYLANA